MVSNCCAYGCHGSSDIDRGVKFHCFPHSRPDVLQKWIKAVRRQNFTPTKYTRICSRHFVMEDYFGGRLKRNAVPSIFDFSATAPKNSTKILAPRESEPSSPEEVQPVSPEELPSFLSEESPPSPEDIKLFPIDELKLSPEEQVSSPSNFSNTILSSSGWNSLARLGLDKSEVEVYIEDPEVIPSSRQFHIVKVARTWEKGTQTLVAKCAKCRKNDIKVLHQRVRRRDMKIKELKTIISNLRKELNQSKKRKIKFVGNSIVLLDESLK